MRPSMIFSKRPTSSLVCMVVLLTLAACHDAPRNNPFDPALTPAVEWVSAALDDTSGVVTLEWTPYAGRQPFAAYWVLRKVKGLEAVDTLRVIEDIDRTVFRDETPEPDVEYVYWIAVVNQGGFEAPGEQVTLLSFSVPGSALLEARADSLTGTVSLRWARYRGARFERYEVLRRGFGEERRDTLATLTGPADTTWMDTTPVPETDYLYSVITFAAGQKRESKEREVKYALPPVELAPVDFDYLTATAELSWTTYPGPQFAAYEIHRQVRGSAEQIVNLLSDKSRTTYTDSLLDGNTTYTYWISVRTTWGTGIEAVGNRREGRFYALEEPVRRVRGIKENTKPHAVSLALDEEDGLYVAMTTISTTTAGAMQGGFRIALPGQTALRFHYFGGRPDIRSPIHVTAGHGKVYVSVASNEDSTLVTALDREGRDLWTRWVDTDGAFPVGLHLEENGDVLMVDEWGWLYRFSQVREDSVTVVRSDRLHLYINIPLRRAVVAPGAGSAGGDQFFLLAERGDHRVFGHTRVATGGIFGGRFTFDNGVGLDNGESLTPVALAFDRAHGRLLVLEEYGRVQVFDAAPEVEEGRRYITKWGAHGRADGEFQISLPISAAMGVDSAGRVYVVDESGRIQVFAP